MNIWPKQYITEVADGISVVLNGSGEVGVSNASFITESGHALVIDTMTFPEMVEGMAHEIARRGVHVDAVLNTHHHIDHMGGNKRFAEARIVAHPLSVQSLQKLGFPVKIYDHLMPQFRGHFSDLELVPPEPLLDQLIPPLGGELLIFTPAHTQTDVAVWFPKQRVLIAGDTSFIGVTPLAVNGLISGWIDALDTLLALKPEIVVPGHGRIGTQQDLITLRNYFQAIYTLGQSAIREGLSLEDALAHFDVGPVAEWIEQERTSINLDRAMQEIRGEISHTHLDTLPPSLIQSH